MMKRMQPKGASVLRGRGSGDHPENSGGTFPLSSMEQQLRSTKSNLNQYLQAQAQITTSVLGSDDPPVVAEQQQQQRSNSFFKRSMNRLSSTGTGGGEQQQNQRLGIGAAPYQKLLVSSDDCSAVTTPSTTASSSVYPPLSSSCDRSSTHLTTPSDTSSVYNPTETTPYSTSKATPRVGIQRNPIPVPGSTATTESRLEQEDEYNDEHHHYEDHLSSVLDAADGVDQDEIVFSDHDEDFEDQDEQQQHPASAASSGGLKASLFEDAWNSDPDDDDDQVLSEDFLARSGSASTFGSKTSRSSDNRSASNKSNRSTSHRSASRSSSKGSSSNVRLARPKEQKARGNQQHTLFPLSHHLAPAPYHADPPGLHRKDLEDTRRRKSKSPIRKFLKSFAHDMRHRKSRSGADVTAVQQQPLSSSTGGGIRTSSHNNLLDQSIKSVKIRNTSVAIVHGSNASSHKSTTSNCRPVEAIENIYVLLLNPIAKIFELIQLSYFPSKTTVGDIVKMIPKHVTEPALGSQVYIGLTRPKKRSNGFTDLTLCLSDQSGNDSAGIRQGEILVALPDGYTRYQIIRLAKKILANPRIQKLVEESEKLSSTSNNNSAKKKRIVKRLSSNNETTTTTEKTAVRRSSKNRKAPMTPEALEVTRLAEGPSDRSCQREASPSPRKSSSHSRLTRAASSRSRGSSRGSSRSRSASRRRRSHTRIVVTTPPSKPRNTTPVLDSFDSFGNQTPEFHKTTQTLETTTSATSPGSCISLTSRSNTSEFYPANEQERWASELVMPGHPLLSTHSTLVFSGNSWADSVGRQSGNPKSNPHPVLNKSFASLKSPTRMAVRNQEHTRNTKPSSSTGGVPVGVVLWVLFCVLLVRYVTDPNGLDAAKDRNNGQEPLGFIGGFYFVISAWALLKLQRMIRRSNHTSLADWYNDEAFRSRIYQTITFSATTDGRTYLEL